MAGIFITGSADGLGHLAAKWLVQQGYKVVLHARNLNRGEEALAKVPGAAGVLTGDLSDMEQVKQLASEANAFGRFDAVIHNAGVYRTAGELIFRVNTMAPYILTSLMEKPERLIYLSSGLHMQGSLNPPGFNSQSISYSDSKLHVILLAKAVAHKWRGTYANAVDPGWVPTKMGGAGAPGSLEKGFETQVWLATDTDEKVQVGGSYFYHKREKHYNPEADNTAIQEEFLKLCEQVSGVKFPD